jgi:hypothetical protein
MRHSSEIFTSKANLKAAILKAETITIKFAKNYDKETQDVFHLVSSGVNIISMANETFIGDMMTPDVDIYNNDDFHAFINEIWYHCTKSGSRVIAGILIDGEIQDLDKMATSAAKADAKKVLNKTEIEDNSIGMVKVMSKVDAKLVLEGDDLLAELMDTVGSIMTRRRGVNSFGLGQHDMRWQMDDVLKIQETLNKITKEMVAAKTSAEVRADIDKLIEELNK